MLKIYDSHVHVGRTRDLSWHVLDPEKYMNDNGIDKCVVMSTIPQVDTIEDANKDIGNAYWSDSIKRLYFINSFAENIGFNASFCGLKYHPSIMQADVTCDFNRVYLDNYSIPVLVHCGRDPISDLSYLITACRDYPNTKFIAAHLGGMVADKIIHNLQYLLNDPPPNLYMDTSAVKRPNLIKEAVRVLGNDKVLFGSDEPFCDFRLAIDAVLYADLNTLQLERVLYYNAEELYA